MAAFDGPDNQADISPTEQAERSIGDHHIDEVWRRVQSWATRVTC